MPFVLAEACSLLERTPGTLDAWLRGLPDRWVRATEGPDTWSPYDIVGHLIHGERTDWIPRARLILEHGDAKPFEPFDRLAQFRDREGLHLGVLLDRFAALRRENLATLRGWNLSPALLERPGLHPALGPVTLGQLLATWVAHDLTHLHQISRVLARTLEADVGPWTAYLGVMRCSGHSD